jgi:hypothetical protein
LLLTVLYIFDLARVHVDHSWIDRSPVTVMLAVVYHEAEDPWLPGWLVFGP